MKVVCTQEVDWFFRYVFTRRFWWSRKKPVKTSGPKKGEVVTVESEYWSNGKRFYILVEWTNGGYESIFFKPLENGVYEEVTFSKIVEKEPVPSVN
jgi:hypothetical protein